VGDDANTATPLYREFNKRLRAALRARVTLDDLVLLPFGHGHAEALDGLPFTLVESGIGYPTLYDGAEFRVFESYAWLHWHQGRANRNGRSYEWVIPNYFDVDAWDLNLDPDPSTVVYFGRICDMKGLPTVVEIARRRPDLHFIICGQGDPAPYLTEPNIEYKPPVTGRDRSALLGSATAVLMPTAYTEPFGGVAVEAMLCGTPVISTAFGAFTETVEDEVTGFRCHTLGDFLAALERASSLDRAYISARARRLYGYERVARMYDRAFQQIADLDGPGWYSERSAFHEAEQVD
jgi:glycosyltransferase involved in cell wall biosynthesis